MQDLSTIQRSSPRCERPSVLVCRCLPICTPSRLGAPAKLLQVEVVEQVEEGGIGAPALEILSQSLGQGLPVPYGKSLQITGAETTTEDPGAPRTAAGTTAGTHSAAIATIQNSFDAACQIIRRGLIN